MKTVQFSERQAAALAIFLSEIVRQGVTYEVKQLIGGWSVTLTGGY